MTENEQFLTITVTTTAGRDHTHKVSLPRDQGQAQAKIAQQFEFVRAAFTEKLSCLALIEPFAVYTMAYVVRIELITPGAYRSEIEQRAMGFQLPKR